MALVTRAIKGLNYNGLVSKVAIRIVMKFLDLELGLILIGILKNVVESNNVNEMHERDLRNQKMGYLSVVSIEVVFMKLLVKKAKTFQAKSATINTLFKYSIA